MKKLSKFELGIIIAFVVIGLMGGGVWYWMSSQADQALENVRAAKSKYDSLSTTNGIVVSQSNKKTLETNIELLKAQIDPILSDKLNAKGDKLSTIDKVDPVAWKHDLDDRIRDLNKLAREHLVKVPSANYYFSFSKYTGSNPDDDKTLVLSKQLLGVEQLATILINAPVKSITSLRRTYEEEAPSSNSPRNGNKPVEAIGPATEPDRLTGFALRAPDNAYTDYPYEVDFDVTVDGLRKVIGGVTNSPYIFVIRSISIANEQSTSRETTDLPALAGTPNPPAASITDSAPGDVAATFAPPVKGPQYLFGNSILHVKTRIDLIEWNGGN